MRLLSWYNSFLPVLSLSLCLIPFFFFCSLPLTVQRAGGRQLPWILHPRRRVDHVHPVLLVSAKSRHDHDLHVRLPIQERVPAVGSHRFQLPRGRLPAPGHPGRRWFVSHFSLPLCLSASEFP